MRNETGALVLTTEHVRELGERASLVAERSPDDRVEARVPQPCERIGDGVRHRVALGLPMRLHDGPHAIAEYRHRAMPTCAIVSFRLGGSDGVSIVASSWADALRSYGFDVVTVAGDGPVDRLIAALALDARPPITDGELDDEVDAALSDADL